MLSPTWRFASNIAFIIFTTSLELLTDLIYFLLNKTHGNSSSAATNLSLINDANTVVIITSPNYPMDNAIQQEELECLLCAHETMAEAFK